MVQQGAKENIDIDTGDDGKQIDEIAHISNEMKDENCDRSVIFTLQMSISFFIPSLKHI